MKKTSMLMIALIVAVAALCTACACSSTPTPSPSPVVSPIITPDMTAEPTDNPPIVSDSPDTDTDIGESPEISGSPSTDTNATGTIEGFEEGKTVEVESVPDVSAAIKAQYPDATVKSVSYITYMDEQMYLVMLEGAGEADKVYVKGDGTIVPYSSSSGGSTNSGT